jgi:hypothetical protein
MVGRKRKPEGSRMMMRKTSLILLGAAAGVAVTLIATPPRIALDGARAQATAADTYRQLSLFGDVFERVRADYVEKPDDSKLIESAINGMLAGLDPHHAAHACRVPPDLSRPNQLPPSTLVMELTNGQEWSWRVDQTSIGDAHNSA